MSGHVVDANTTLAWLWAEPGNVEKLPADFAETAMIVPWLWRTEVTNAVLVRERRKHLTQAQGTRYLQILDSLALEVVGEPVRRSLEALGHFARPCQLTSYDALYLELAVTLGRPLCTLDKGMQDAARRLGIELVIDRDRSDG